MSDRVRLTAKEWSLVLSIAEHLTDPPASSAHYTSIGEQRARREGRLREAVEEIVAAHVAPWREIPDDAATGLKDRGLLDELDQSAAEWDAQPDGTKPTINDDYWPRGDA